jgi:diguanylate cyclase (GGDEF)-like protein
MPARSEQGSSNGHHGAGLDRFVGSGCGAAAAGLEFAKEPSNLIPRPPTPVRRAGPTDKDLEELLSGALLSTDKELADVVRQVDEISKALRAGAVDTQALRVAAHPAVWYAVRHAILERELRYLALTDDLTCLYNRRGFFAAATQQLRLARRNLKSILLFFIDIDGLKQVNDKYGHREGDLALVRTADALEETFRDSDIIARLGGDEFAVLAPEASAKHQQTLLHRLTASLAKTSTGEARYWLSVSVGTARFDPQHAVTLGELMAQADKAMYEQKRSAHATLSRK